jgi:hypothetical protein
MRQPPWPSKAQLPRPRRLREQHSHPAVGWSRACSGSRSTPRSSRRRDEGRPASALWPAFPGTAGGSPTTYPRTDPQPPQARDTHGEQRSPGSWAHPGLRHFVVGDLENPHLLWRIHRALLKLCDMTTNVKPRKDFTKNKGAEKHFRLDYNEVFILRDNWSIKYK